VPWQSVTDANIIRANSHRSRDLGGRSLWVASKVSDAAAEPHLIWRSGDDMPIVTGSSALWSRCRMRFCYIFEATFLYLMNSDAQLGQATTDNMR